MVLYHRLSYHVNALMYLSAANKNGPTKPKGVPVSTVAGVSTGIILLVVLVAAFLVLWLPRYRQKKKREDQIDVLR